MTALTGRDWSPLQATPPSSPRKMQDRQPAVMAVTIVVFVLASIFVALRFVSRIGIVHRIGLHDYFMILAWVRGVHWPALSSPLSLRPLADDDVVGPH